MRTQALKVLSLLIASLLTSFPVTCWTAAPAQPEAMHGFDKYKRVGPPPAAPPAATAIPNVVGKKTDAAQAELKSAGFTVKIGKATTTNDAHKYNTVHDQDPDGGINAASGSAVTLFVLVPPVGSPPVTVPNLIGKTANDAAAALKAAGFTGRAAKTQTANSAGHGHVVSQTPAAGTAIPLNVYVDYQVGEMSAAPAPPVAAVEKTRVPDIVGRDSSTAMNMLMGAGLQMHVSRIEQLGGISDRRSGQIAHQEPSRGSEVNKGTTVNVRVFGQR